MLQVPTSGVWCGFSDVHKYRKEVSGSNAMVLGGAEIGTKGLYKLTLVRTDESGDWAVNDIYLIANGRPTRLERTINIIPDDTSTRLVYAITAKGAKLRYERAQSLTTGKAVHAGPQWFQPPPPITKLAAFPFFSLISTKRLKILNAGSACEPNGASRR